MTISLPFGPAGLPQVPALYYVPSRMLNAFAVGQSEEVAIALTDGLLRHLTLRELAGVLAYEVSHVRNQDLWIMGLADAIGRLTSLISFFGMILLVIDLPYLLVGEVDHLPWVLIALLVFAPTIGSLLQPRRARDGRARRAACRLFHGAGSSSSRRAAAGLRLSF